MLVGESGLLRVKPPSATPLPLLWVLRLLETRPDAPRAAGIASWSQSGRVPRFPELSADEAPLRAG